VRFRPEKEVAIMGRGLYLLRKRGEIGKGPEVQELSLVDKGKKG